MTCYGKAEDREMDRERLLCETELFVLDMDGTFYLDDQILDGSLDFLRELERLGKRFVFFTNNSSKWNPPDKGHAGCGRNRL